PNINQALDAAVDEVLKLAALADPIHPFAEPPGRITDRIGKPRHVERPDIDEWNKRSDEVRDSARGKITDRRSDPVKGVTKTTDILASVENIDTVREGPPKPIRDLPKHVADRGEIIMQKVAQLALQ